MNKVILMGRLVRDSEKTGSSQPILLTAWLLEKLGNLQKNF